METITIYSNNYQNEFIVKLESNGLTVLQGKGFVNSIPKDFEEIEIKTLPNWKQEIINEYIEKARLIMANKVESNKRVEQMKKDYKRKDKPFKQAFVSLINSIETL